MQRSRADSRERLAGAPMLVGIALAFGALLASVVPTRAEYTRNLERPSDARSLPYLSALARASGDDRSIELLYVRRLQSLGRFDAALDALGPASPKTADPTTANLRFDLLLAKARAQPDGTAARTSAFGDVARELGTLRSVPQTDARLRELARVALEVGEPHWAAEYLFAAASLSAPADRAATLVEAGRWLRAAGDESRAADCFARAAEAESDPARARTDRALAVDAVEAEGQAGPAADLAASFVSRDPDDLSMLARATALASAAGRAKEARDLGRQLVSLEPDDDAAIRDQARRELAAGDPRGALADIALLVTRHPEDQQWRRVEARVAEWAGDPSLALGDWLWLFAQGGDTSAPETALP
jgi:tetratricopeptide (TPR) repeat protein